MKKPKRKNHAGRQLLASLVLVGLATSIFIYSSYQHRDLRAGKPFVPKEELPLATQLTPAQMKEDLATFEKQLAQVHPATAGGFSDETKAALEQAKKSVKSPKKVSEFTTILNQVAATLQDGHTAAVRLSDRQIPAQLRYIEDKLYVKSYSPPQPAQPAENGEGSENEEEAEPATDEEDGGESAAADGGQLQPGDELVSIGGVPISRITGRLKVITPTETGRSDSGTVKNSGLFYRACENDLLRESTLYAAGVDTSSGTVAVAVQRGGQQVTCTATLADPAAPSFSYTIESGVCQLVLPYCDSGKEAASFLKEAFGAIKQQKVHTLVVDLRQNGGSGSDMTALLMPYIDVDNVKQFSNTVTRYSDLAAAQLGYRLTIGSALTDIGLQKNERQSDLLFTGPVYCLIDEGVYGTANDLAIALHDSGAAKLVGSDTAAASTGYGAPVSGQLKNSGICYRISHQKITRFADSDAAALTPDIAVKITPQELASQSDSHLQAVWEDVKKQK